MSWPVTSALTFRVHISGGEHQGHTVQIYTIDFCRLITQFNFKFFLIRKEHKKSDDDNKRDKKIIKEWKIDLRLILYFEKII